MHLNKKELYTSIIKNKAREIGFDFCGISKAGFLSEEAGRLENWLQKEMHGSMKYMENYFDKRLDPTKLVEGTKSVISLLLNYYPETKQEENENFKISKYAYGQDYHFVIKEKLEQLLYSIKESIGDVQGRGFVDSAPVLDKAWAKKAGLGWMGKNSNLINKNSGSFYFIANLFVDLELEYDGQIKDYCGTCTQCIDACPTEAITEPYVVDGSKCISYLTIELKNEIPQEFVGKMDNWIFGCDICQDVCPWNSFSKFHTTHAFDITGSILGMNKADWLELSEQTFKTLFKHSPIKRTKWKGLKRNIDFVS